MGREPFDMYSGIKIMQALSKYKHRWHEGIKNIDREKWLALRTENEVHWKDIMYGSVGGVGFGNPERTPELLFLDMEFQMACEIRYCLRNFSYIFHNLDKINTNEIAVVQERYRQWQKDLDPYYEDSVFSDDPHNRILLDQCDSYFKDAIFEMENALSRKRAYKPAIESRNTKKKGFRENFSRTTTRVSKRVFIAHGHDEAKMWELKNFLQNIGLTPIILHEQDDLGKTIVEKFEYYASQCVFAFILITPDDQIPATDTPQSRWRARQNVIMELGWFMARLGRGRVVLLHKGSVEIPSDVSGVIYLAFKDSILEVSEKIRQRLEGAALIPKRA